MSTTYFLFVITLILSLLSGHGGGSCLLVVVDFSPGFGCLPADQSSVPQWLDLTCLLRGSAAQTWFNLIKRKLIHTHTFCFVFKAREMEENGFHRRILGVMMHVFMLEGNWSIGRCRVLLHTQKTKQEQKHCNRSLKLDNAVPFIKGFPARIHPTKFNLDYHRHHNEGLPPNEIHN